MAQLISRSLALGTVMAGMLLACGGSQKPKDQLKAEVQGLPKWALGNCQDALDNKDTLCATGSMQGTGNINLARAGAEARARTELARALQVRVKSMLKDYQATTQGGPENQSSSEQHLVDVSKQVSDVTLSGSRLKETYVNEETGTFWALVVLEPDAFKESLKQAQGLDDRLRSHIIQRADRAFRELEAQTGP